MAGLTIEDCKNEALKYSTIKEFKKNSPRFYSYITKHKWNGIVFAHYKRLQHKPYTFEDCQKEALKYKSRSDFAKNSCALYDAAAKHKWLDDICGHMVSRIHLKPYTFEECKNEALKYKSKSEFMKNSNGFYIASLKNKWIDEICKHMNPLGNVYKRCIYAYIFLDKYVYVGLTSNLKRRNEEHHRKGSVFLFSKEYGIEIPEPKKLTEYIEVNEAIEKEKYFLDLYKNKGLIPINKAKTGSIGGNIHDDNRIVIFNNDGNFVDLLSKEDIYAKYGIRKELVNLCLRGVHKSSGGFRFITYSQWLDMNKPFKIEKYYQNNIRKKIAIIDNDFNLLKIYDNKSSACDGLKIGKTNNSIKNLKENLILNVGKKHIKCCYYVDYIKYKNGIYYIYKPQIPKCKKILFIPLEATEKEKDRLVESLLKEPQWKINRKIHRRNKYNKMKVK